MKKLSFLMGLLTAGFALDIYPQPLSEENKLFPLSNEEADLLCDTTRSHLKDLALLLLCGTELKNQPIELMNNFSDELTAVNRGSSLTIYSPFFRPTAMIRFDISIKKDEKTDGSTESKSVIEVVPSFFKSQIDGWNYLKGLSSWSVPTAGGIVESGAVIKFSPQEFGALLQYCARRKPKLESNAAQ